MRRRRLGIETSITRTAARIENGCLSFESKNRAVDVWFAEECAGVVDEIARRKVVGAVENHVVIAKDVEGVVGCERAFVRGDLDVGIQRLKMLTRGFQLWTANVLCFVEYLAV